MILLISYDLNGHERPSAYADVRDVIQDRAIDYRRPLYSQWFVETYDSPEEWVTALREVTDANDKLFVCQVRPPYQGWFSKEVWPWLRERV